MLGFQENQSFFHITLRNSIHVHCVCLAESINKWVERMAVRGGWRQLSGLICEIVNSVGQGNFTFVREKSQGISNTYGCGNHELRYWDSINYIHYFQFDSVSSRHIRQFPDILASFFFPINTLLTKWRCCLSS